MSEEHIKTVVLDPPPAKLVDDEKSNERRGDETLKGDTAPGDKPAAPLRSWLS